MEDCSIVGDTVDDDGDGEDQKHRRPPVGELSPEAGERVVLKGDSTTVFSSDWSLVCALGFEISSINISVRHFEFVLFVE